MTFTPPDSLAGSVDLDTTDVEVNFERRVANCVAKHVKKKVACMFWTIIILLVVWSLLACFLMCMLYNHNFHVTVVMNTTTTTVADCSSNLTVVMNTTVANCSANVTEEYITRKEHTILLKEEMNKAAYSVVAGFFAAAAAAVGSVSSP